VTITTCDGSLTSATSHWRILLCAIVYIETLHEVSRPKEPVDSSFCLARVVTVTIYPRQTERSLRLVKNIASEFVVNNPFHS
jgi:hypothetical protein